MEIDKIGKIKLVFKHQNNRDMKRIIVISVFSSFLVGKVCGQNPPCDTLKDAKWEGKAVLDPYVHQGDFPTVDLPTPPDPNEVRRIYFIHGLGGTDKAWEKAAEACWNTGINNGLGIPGFPARKCETTRPDYNNSTGSLASAADGLRTAISIQANNDSINGNQLKRSRAMLIGHSQGGLVIRQLMRLDMVQQPGHSTLAHGMNYGGVVTFASPLQGAKILDNRDKIFEMANEGCNKLLLGAANDVYNGININLDLGKFGSAVVSLIGLENTLTKKIQAMLRKMVENLVPTVCNVATDNVMPMFFKHYYAGITEDYKVGASTINTLNSDTNYADYRKFPKVAFYAVEPQENIFWRTLNWMVYDPNGHNGANGPNVGYFEANDDWKLYNDMIKPMIDHYQTSAEKYYAEYLAYDHCANYFAGLKNQYCDWWKIVLCPPLAAHCATYDYERTRAIQKRDLRYKGYVQWSEGLEWFNNANESWKTIIGARVQNGNTVTYKENDGVVLAESAGNLPKTQKAVKINGSSHMQIRNDNNTKEHLNKLFNGDYGMWFFVNIAQ